jgi:hypothetical protein
MSINNVKRTGAEIHSPGPANIVKKTESLVPSGVPVKNIRSSTPLHGLHHNGIKCTQSNGSAMQVTDNGSTGIDAILLQLDESGTGLNNEAYHNKPLLLTV